MASRNILFEAKGGFLDKAVACGNAIATEGGVACLLEDLATGKKALLFPLGQHYDESTLAATKWSFDSTKVHDPGGGDISVAQPTNSTWAATNNTLAATKGSFDSTKVHDPGGGSISVVQATSSTTVGDQMLSGRSQNVFRDKVRLKPVKHISIEKQGTFNGLIG